MNQSLESKVANHLCANYHHRHTDDFRFFDCAGGLLVTVGGKHPSRYRISTYKGKIQRTQPITTQQFNRMKR